MAKKKRKTPDSEKIVDEASGLPKGWTEFLGVALLAIGGLMFGGLCSYQFGDGELMGPVGRLVAGALYAGFGMASYLVVLGVVGVGIKALLGRRMELRIGEGIGFSAATVAGCVLLHVLFPSYRVQGYTAGGLSGELLGEVSLGLFDYAGTYLISSTVIVIGLIASTPLNFDHLVLGGRMAYRVSAGVVGYLWEGSLSVLRAQRDLRREYDEEEAEYDDYEGDEEDEEPQDEALDGEEEEMDGELEAVEPEKKSPRKKSISTRRANTKRDEKGTGDSALVDPSAEFDPIDLEQELPAAKKPRKVVSAPGKRTKKRSTTEASMGADAIEQRPEIVVSDEVAEGVDAPNSNQAGGKHKKAPLRVADLAAARAAAQPVASVAPKKRAGAQEVKYLTERYELPPLELFSAANTDRVEVDKDHVYAQAEAIVQALAQFKIKGKVTKVHPGPVITRYEFKPEAGVKVSRIQNLENDLAMALEAIRIRILAPIPGKSTVGLEVPNKVRETVFVHENLSDPEFANNKTLPLVLGKDIVGKTQCLDLAKAPHLLVAGATGSGKSVGVNSMLCSLLYTCTPEALRLILIDPKMLEFSVYSDIPHLLLPVITDAEKANLALRWTVNEMERRYEVLSGAGVRSLEGFNKKIPQLQADWDGEKVMLEREAQEAAAIVREEGEEAIPGAALPGMTVRSDGEMVPSFGGVEMADRPETLPYIVVVIDEFADLMMVASKEVETSVARIAAKARAAGIHLILATQRPSVDVITGTIKNNFPSRIAFQVTSDVDSRTILDQKGAKQLLGMGDMLYMDRGKDPERVHGCYVSEQEIDKVVEFVKKQAKPAYNMDITKDTQDDANGESARSHDPLYDKAVEIVAEAQKVSTSMIQRRLNVGYNRAANIVEQMEEDGVIGPSQGSKPRDVYVSAA